MITGSPSISNPIATTSSIVPAFSSIEELDPNLQALSQEDPNKYSIQEVVQKVLDFQKNSWRQFDNFDENEAKKELTSLEMRFRQLKPNDIPKQWDSYKPCGGIRWSMTLAEINSYAQKKFDNLRKSGILLFRSEFERLKDPTKFCTLGKGRFSKGSKSGQLDRLWGAEYLRKNLAQNPLYKVPDYVIVIEDNVKSLPVNVYQEYKALMLSDFETSYGEILAENIKGTKALVTQEKLRQHFWLKKLGYDDFGDPGNILEGEDNKFYIVDTEWKSLAGLEKSNENNHPDSQLWHYMIDRFKTFNPWESKKIDVEIKKDLFPSV